MAINIPLRLPFPLRKPKNPRVLIEAIGTILFCMYCIWLVFVLYSTVFREALAPSAVDPSQITERQQKVNRALLESIQKREEERLQRRDIPQYNDPFVSP
jgi:hypothetical protein